MLLPTPPDSRCPQVQVMNRLPSWSDRSALAVVQLPQGQPPDLAGPPAIAVMPLGSVSCRPKLSVSSQPELSLAGPVIHSHSASRYGSAGLV